jgi:hypothetical protein
MSEGIISVGMALALSSGILFRYRLTQFSSFLKTNCPQIWESHVTADGRASKLVRYNNLGSLPLTYKSDNIEINSKLKSLALLHKSSYIGLLVVFVGIIVNIMQALDT